MGEPVSVIAIVSDAGPGHSQSWEQAASVLSAGDVAHELIVVAFESHSTAGPELERLPNVRFIQQARVTSWGQALLAACEHAQNNLICTVDSQTLYALAELSQLVRTQQENCAAMVVGVQIGKEKPISARRRLVPWLVDMAASQSLGFPILDLNSGLRLICRNELQTFSDCLSTRSALPATLTLQMLTRGASVMYLPLNSDPDAPARFSHGLGKAPNLLSQIISTGFKSATLRTVSFIARMLLMTLMMAAMGIMMMWMMGMFPAG